MESEFRSCPKCQSTDVKRKDFHWLIGAFGAKRLELTECNACKTNYSGKTGKAEDVTKYTIMATLIGAGIGLGVALVWGLLKIVVAFLNAV